MSTPISDTSTSAETRPTPTIVRRRWMSGSNGFETSRMRASHRDQRRQLVQLGEHLPEEEGMERRRPAAQRLRERLHLRGEQFQRGVENQRDGRENPNELSMASSPKATPRWSSRRWSLPQSATSARASLMNIGFVNKYLPASANLGSRKRTPGPRSAPLLIRERHVDPDLVKAYAVDSAAS
jgi:hypothetical protein